MNLESFCAEALFSFCPPHSCGPALAPAAAVWHFSSPESQYFIHLNEVSLEANSQDQPTCERFMASLAQLSTSLWRSSVKVPFLWWGADILGARHWELPWLWHKPEPLTALVLFVPAEGGERERERRQQKQVRVSVFRMKSDKCSKWMEMTSPY